AVICQNYRKKCGEIDIIAQKGKILHFIEVKSVTRENIGKNVSLRPLLRPGVCAQGVRSADSETGDSEFANSETDSYRPEDNIHPYKLRRLARTIQMYLIEKYRGNEPDWVFDAIIVKLDIYNRRARVRFLDNIVL
ncbi:MAG: YraN family protein, partial [Minisyncoccia bacterium]